MSESLWKPSADVARLRARAALNRTIRAFFEARGVTEVEVPLMASTAALDPHIDSFSTQSDSDRYYLQSSPEYLMKRLLAAGAGDIYQLGKAFRREQAGRLHNPEFTLLEWYRCGFDDRKLMQEVAELIGACLPGVEQNYLSYGDLFERYTDLNPHTASIRELMRCGQREVGVDWQDDDRNLWLDLLMTHVVEPAMPQGLLFVFDYPVSHAALARTSINDRGEPVAKRFEVFLNGVELANGYWELTDTVEQRQRFEEDCLERSRLQKEACAMDERLLQAMASGLPDCAGVALGVDRLLMVMCGAECIGDVISFDHSAC